MAFYVSCCEGLRLAVTVRAEHSEILDSMIVANAVDVVDLDGQRTAPPFTQAAPVATVFDYTSLEQVSLNCLPAPRLGHRLGKGKADRSRHDSSGSYGLGPRSSAEAELGAALPVAGTGLVVDAYRAPIIAFPAVGIRAARAVDHDIAEPDCLLPRGMGNAKSRPALPEPVSSVDIRLHRRPVKVLPVPPPHEHMFA